jgi:hypothetical protein
VTRRISAADIGDDQIRRAAASGPLPVVGKFGSADDATLYMPKVPQRVEAEERRDAARCTARYLMLRSHGCTGRSCRKRGHAGDREAMRDLLGMLGLDEVPGAAGVRRAWR